MIVVTVRIPIASEEQAQAIIERFRHRSGLVDNRPGFLGFQLLRGEAELMTVTRWKTRADLDRWMGSEAHTQVHSRVGVAGGHSHASHEGQSHGGGQSQQQGGMTGNVSIYEVVIGEEGRG